MINPHLRLTSSFFEREAGFVAESLLGKIIRKKNGCDWLSARIIETEAYYIEEKGSHASLGFTPKRKALFMPPGTIYMYYSRGKDSLNISSKGQGNAVLIKSGIPYLDCKDPNKMIKTMQINNPVNSAEKLRSPLKLCSGQTLLCKSLGITVKDWNQKQFDTKYFFVEDGGIQLGKIIQAKRIGIPTGRDDHLLYRYIDFENVKFCTKNPLTVKKNRLNRDYLIKNPSIVNTMMGFLMIGIIF